ncbi:MAG: response regulator transcription factor [Clostridiales bacterium]|nr:response regulator transcription factor [Clostridiales bacterium]
MAKILIIEDDKAINDLMKMNLQLVGYECRQAFDGIEAMSALEKERPDLVLLDVMLPYLDGFSLMEQNAFEENVPVIFVTAKDSTADKVKGLKLGADDYISKPFEAVELLARVEAVLRRTKPRNRIFTLENTVVYLDEHTVKVGDEKIELTNREFELLEVLINNCNIALSREKLLDLAWGYAYFGDTRTVDVHITKLRKKLHLENHIKTVFKLGYRLEVPGYVKRSSQFGDSTK